MERALTGSANDAPLAELYARHVGSAVRLARLLTGRDDEAEDVAHEAFIRAVGRFGHLRRTEAFGAYLRTAVVNECRMRFRRARLERAWLRRQDPAEASVAPVDVETHTAVWAAIERLPWRQRAARVLRYYEDLSVEQIGTTLRCSTRAANALLVRGLARLRSSLPEEEP